MPALQNAVNQPHDAVIFDLVCQQIVKKQMINRWKKLSDIALQHVRECFKTQIGHR